MMSKFKQMLFWCEFPHEVNWNTFNKLLNFETEIYLAVKTKEEFLKYKSKIKNKNVKIIGAWPTLPKKEGYWFSSYTSKKNIDVLNNFKGIPMKIDVEPPLLVNYGFFKMMFIYTKFLITQKGKNKEYLNKTILELAKHEKIILSGFPFPKIISSLYGDDQLQGKNIERNFFIYSTLIPQPLRFLAKFYFKWFINKIKKEHVSPYFAVGCIGHGILENEPTYKNSSELETDLKFLIKNKIEKVIIFDLAGIMNKEKPKEWFNILEKHIQN